MTNGVVKPAGGPGRRTPGPTARGARRRTGGSLLDHQQRGQARRTHRAIPQPARGQAPMRSRATCARRLGRLHGVVPAWRRLVPGAHLVASVRLALVPAACDAGWSGWRSRGQQRLSTRHAIEPVTKHGPRSCPSSHPFGADDGAAPTARVVPAVPRTQLRAGSRG